MRPRAAILVLLALASMTVLAQEPRKFVPMDLKAHFTAGPLSDPEPVSTLLPAGATSVNLAVHAAKPTICHYSVGADMPFAQMTVFDTAAPSTRPTTLIRGLSADPLRVNDVYVRCDADERAVLHLQYRSLPAVKPGFPRVANLWGWWNLTHKGLKYASRIDLWLGASFSAEDARQLRQLNPNCFILTSINTVENNDVPDDYFLRDTSGKKIEVWPGSYRLNLTRPEVADYQARYAYQLMLESSLRYDGCFFDNFMMTQSWQTHDIYGRAVQIDANGDGVADKPEELDAAWREGVFRELRQWRKLMPWALTTGHSQGYPHPEVAEIFNGQGVGFMTTETIEGKHSFAELWDYYNAWCTLALKPAITSVESAVQYQIAYGYDYEPRKKMPPATWDFARDYYPYMRFGLAFVLMNDGYFSHELGDTDHGQDWWYDELDFKLGAPLGPARQVDVGQVASKDLVDNGNFARDLPGTWYMWCDERAGCAATVQREAGSGPDGAAAAHITVTHAGRRGGIEFTQGDRTLEQGKTYDVSFQARADGPMAMMVISSKGSPNWDNYGLERVVHLTTRWQAMTLPLEAKQTVTDARIQFLLGGARGQVWISGVSVVPHKPDVYRRDFQNGIVLLNGTRTRQTLDVGDGYRHLTGQQAPRYQYILDDAGPGFSTGGPWQEVDVGTKPWNAIPPYYHAWNDRCHTLSVAGPARGPGQAEARWDLQLRGRGTYTIQAWWAAAPDAAKWAHQAIYEVVAQGKVVATRTLDQTRDGDQWHTICENLALDPADKPVVRVRTAGAGAGVLAADALHLFSAERLNDGEPVQRVTLEPMDGLILQRVTKPGR
jgi:hypothetical protein